MSDPPTLTVSPGVPGAAAPPPEPVGAARPATPTVQRRAMWAAAVTAVGFGLSQLIRLAGNVVLAWLLAPEAFGLMVLVNTFAQGAEMISSLGVGSALIYHKRGLDPEFLRTAWTMQFARGFAVFALGCLAAIPFAAFYDHPSLFELIAFVMVGNLMAGMGSLSYETMKKRLDLVWPTLAQLASQCLAAGAMILCAWWYPSVWALAIGAVVAQAARAVLGYLMLPTHGHRFGFVRSDAAAIFGYSKWVMFSTAITFLAMQLDRLMLGKLLPLDALGVFGIAMGLAMIFDLVAHQMQTSVIFPAISARQDLSREELNRRLQAVRWRVLPAAAAGMAVAVVFADWLVLLLYDTPYHAAGPMLAWLIAGRWLVVIFATNRPALAAVGHPEYSVLAYLLRLGYVLAAVPVSYAYWGLEGVVIAIALADVPTYVGFNFGLRRERLGALRQDAAATALFGLAVLAMYGVKLGLVAAGVSP